jgi:hypothetical protein
MQRRSRLESHEIDLLRVHELVTDREGHKEGVYPPSLVIVKATASSVYIDHATHNDFQLLWDLSQDLNREHWTSASERKHEEHRS